MPNIISSKQFNKEEVEKILKSVEQIENDFKNNKVEQLLKGKIVACIFFEPSTRTRLSFESASLRLGAQVISSENAMLYVCAVQGTRVCSLEVAYMG